MKGILLFARVPMNVVCLKPIYEALKGETPFWGTVKPPKGTKGGNLFAPLGLRVKTVASWLAPWLPLDIYLSPDIMVVGKLCRWKIHTFHGVSFKGRAYTSKILAYDRLFIIGPYMEERFIEKGILKKGDPRIVRVGMPKLDSERHLAPGQGYRAPGVRPGCHRSPLCSHVGSRLFPQSLGRSGGENGSRTGTYPGGEAPRPHF